MNKIGIKLKRTILFDENKKIEFKLSKKYVIILLTYLMAIVAAEIVTTYYRVELGLLIHISILSTLLINSSLTESKGFSNLLRSMMILPMIRIIGLSMPVMQVNPLYWFPVISIPLFAASVILMRNQKLSRREIGLVLDNMPVQLSVALSGVFLGIIEYLILKPQPLISSFTLETVLYAGAILIISTGFAEELLFRGILQTNAEKLTGKVYGLVYTSLLFTALHVGWNSIIDLTFVFGVAMFYGYVFSKTRSLFGITFSHGISNSFLFLIMPFLFQYLFY